MRRPSLKTKSFLILTGVIAILLVILMSPIFGVNEVIITGSAVYSEDDILMAAGFNQDSNNATNLFRVNTRHTERDLSALPFIRSANVTKQFPNTLIIQINERIPFAQVFNAQQGLYITIDDEGYVLEAFAARREGLPVVVGVRVAGFSIGHRLETDDEHLLPIISRISDVLKTNGLTNVARIDISNVSDIRLLINDITVVIGSMQDLNLKIMWASAILGEEQFAPPVRGTLHTARYKEDMWFAIGE